MKYKAGVFLYDKEKSLVLLVRALPLKKWGAPKGEAESRETYWECARREFQEEVGINLYSFPEFKVVDLGVSRYKMMDQAETPVKLKCFLFIVNKFYGAVKLNHENDEFKWVSLSDIENELCRSQKVFANRIKSYFS